MSGRITVYKNRTNTITVNMGMDVSADTITSQIRAKPEVTSALIAEWAVSYPVGGDGTDGEIVLTMDDVITAQIAASIGYMDIKRVVGGEPVPVFEQPLEVVFQGAVTE